MRVSVDVHDVLADYIGRMIKVYGPAPGGYEVEWMREMWPELDWELHFEHNYHNDFISKLEPIPGAVVGLQTIAKKFDCFYLSANSGEGTLETEKWLDRYSFPKLEMVLTGSNKGKEAYIFGLPTNTIVIDDMACQLRAAAMTGKLAIALAQPWNKNVHGILRCATWEDICRALSYVNP